jgi:hypothetical protein
MATTRLTIQVPICAASPGQPSRVFSATSAGTTTAPTMVIKRKR